MAFVQFVDVDATSGNTRIVAVDPVNKIFVESSAIDPFKSSITMGGVTRWVKAQVQQVIGALNAALGVAADVEVLKVEPPKAEDMLGLSNEQLAA